MDQKSEKGFGFGLRLHIERQQHIIIDHTLVSHTFIHCDVSPPITVSTEPTISTGTHPSVSPTGSTTDAPTAAPATDETVPPDSCSTCDAMNEVADQLNHHLPHGQYNCSRSENCSAVMCESHVADLNLYLGCSPVGMTLESIVHTDGLNTYNKALFTKPGTFDSMLFDSDFNVTVCNYNDEVLEFSLSYIGAKINHFHIVSVLVNGTLIPLDHCYGDSSHSKGFSIIFTSH